MGYQEELGLHRYNLSQSKSGRALVSGWIRHEKLTLSVPGDVIACIISYMDSSAARSCKDIIARTARYGRDPLAVENNPFKVDQESSQTDAEFTMVGDVLTR